MSSRYVGRLLGYVLLVLALAMPARASIAGEAEEFISAFADRAVAEVIEAQVTEQERGERIVALLRQHVDFPTVSRFVLGRHWRRANEPERQRFIRAFEASLSYNILSLLDNYSDESLVVDAPARMEKGGKVTIVTSRLLRPQGEAVVVDWRLKRTGEGYRIIDVATEGVSLAITLRAEYSSFLKREGDVAALAAALERRLASDGIAQAKNQTESTQ